MESNGSNANSVRFVPFLIWNVRSVLLCWGGISQNYIYNEGPKTYAISSRYPRIFKMETFFRKFSCVSTVRETVVLKCLYANASNVKTKSLFIAFVHCIILYCRYDVYLWGRGEEKKHIILLVIALRS